MQEKEFFTVLSNCNGLKIRVLNISNCSLNVESATALAKVFNSGALSNLEQLNLGSNHHIGKEVLLFASMSKLKQLKRLDASSCHVTIESMAMLTVALRSGALSNLEHLNLGRNKIGTEDWFFASLSNCTKLKSLNIIGCFVTAQSVSAMTNVLQLKALPILEQLDVAFNEEFGKSDSFFAALSNCPQLKSLNVKFCSLP